MWELDYKEGWALKNWFFQIVVLEKTLESPLDCKEIKLVNPKRNQSWMVIGRTDTDAETPILWPSDTKNWLVGKDPEAGKDWSRRRSEWQRMRRLYDIINLMDMNLRKLWEIVKDRAVWHTAVHGVAKSWMQLSNWTTMKDIHHYLIDV